MKLAGSRHLLFIAFVPLMALCFQGAHLPSRRHWLLPNWTSW